MIQGALLLLFAVAVAYGPAWKAKYVWDDDELVVGNPLLHSRSGIWAIWTKPMSLNNEEHYWPLNYSTLWLERQLLGESPLASHLINVAIHLGNALLVWWLFMRLGIGGTWFGAFLFALHPGRVESVAWILERNGLLSCLFCLVAFGTYWEWLNGGRRKWLLAGLLAYALALLSKSIAVALPAVLLITLWWKRGRVETRCFLRLLPLLAVGLLLAGWDFVVVRHHPQMPSGMTLSERVMLVGREFWFYLGKWIWPYPLCAVYPRWGVENWSAAEGLYTLAFAVLVSLLWFLRDRIGRGPLAAMGAFFVTMSPVLGFVDFNYMSHSFVADRFAYLAAICLTALLCGTACSLLGRFKYSPALAWGGAAALCVVLGGLTFERTKAFESLHTLSSDTVAKNPMAWSALTNEGNWMKDQGRLDDAIALYERALAIAPDVALTHNGLGAAYTEKGEHAKALSEFEKAVKLKPDFAFAEHNIGLEHLNAHRYGEAVEHLTIASRLAPGNVDIRNNFAGALLDAGRIDEAIQQFQEVLKLDPSSAIAYKNLADIQLHREDIAGGIERLRKAVELKPDEAAWVNQLAALLVTADDPKLRNADEAIRLVERACQQTGRKVPAFLSTLGMAYAAAGRAREALAATEEAIAALPAGDTSELAAELRTRRDQYKPH